MIARFLRCPGGWRRLLPAMLIVAGTLGVAAPAAAVTINDFVSAYTKIEQVAPAGSLPVKSADLEASKGFFDCLAKPGNDTVTCVNNFHNTPLGQKASNETGIPSSFWQVVDAYIAYRQNDYWGVAYHLGEAAVCAVVQVLLGGVDACSLIKELVELAKTLYDAGKAVVEFLKDVGGALEDAWCDTGGALLGTCDDGPPTPDEQYVYEYVFLPKIADGVTKRELADGSHEAFVTTLVNNAKHKPYPIVSKPWPYGESGSFGAKTFLYPHFTDKAITNARQIYDKAVDANWSTRVTKIVLPALGTERFQYIQSQLAAVAQQAAQGYVSKPYGDAGAAVKSICYQHFTKTRPYAHVDQWILFHADAAAKVKAVTNTKWCELEFWGQQKTAFTKHFRDYAKTNLCPEYGGSLKCQTLANYKTCIGLMGSVYQQQQCGINAQSVGKDVAQEIKNYFASKKSSYPCSIESANVPVGLRCSRPTQQYHCNKYYQEHFGPKGTTPIPVKVTECALTKDGAYQTKENKFWDEKIPPLKKAHPNLEPYTTQKGYDPLMVIVPPKLYGELEADAKQYGLDMQIVLSTEPGIDGANVATLGSNLGSVLKDQMKTVPVAVIKDKLGGVNPPDPAGKKSLTIIGNQAAVGPGALAAAPTLAQPGQSKVLSGPAPAGKSPKSGGFVSDSAKSSPAGKVVMLPGSTGPASQSLPQSKPLSGGARDLTSAAQLLVGSIATSWGTNVSINDTQAFSRQNGVCQFVIQHGVRNLGSAGSGAFSSIWSNSNAPGSFSRRWGSIAPGGLDTRKDMVELKPGQNILSLTLDNLSQVQETNENNNRLRVVINLTGSCGGTATAERAPATPVEPAPRGRLRLPTQ